MKMKPSNNELLAGFLKTSELYGTAPSTIIRKRNVIVGFIKWLDAQEKHVLDITKFDIEDWISTEKAELKINSKAQLSNTLKSFYEYLIERKHVTDNPVSEVQKRMNRGRKKTRRPILSVQDVIKLIKASTNPRDRAIILVFLKQELG